MVRTGEYSPNFRGNRAWIEGANRGIFGFGEYEEKRKYYNEQRKLEFKQYIAQQALKGACSKGSKNISPVLATDTSVFVGCEPAKDASDISTSIRREVSTQTANRDLRDASTNTDVASSKESNVYAQCNDHLIHDSSKHSHQTDKWKIRKGVTTGTETAFNDSCVALPGNLRQDALKEKDHPHLSAVTAAYERELRAQIEEKKNRTRELERIEQQEEKSRERWLAKEASRELERHIAEEKRIKELDDCRKQRAEEFRSRSEQLQREAKEMRRMKIINQRECTYNMTIGAESVGSGKSYSLGEVSNEKRSKFKPPAHATHSSKLDKLKLTKETQGVTQERFHTQDSIGKEVLKEATTAEAIPKICHPFCPEEDDDVCPNSATEENQSSGNIFSQLGEIRRHLTAQQVKMEEAVKKVQSPEKTK